MTSDTQSNVDISVAYLREHITLKPEIALVLGSGLGDFADSVDGRTSIPSTDIPHYPRSTVEGHKGHLVFGIMKNKPLLAFQGRIHFYESNNLDTVLYPIRTAHALGVKTLIVTNAAGGVNRSFAPGDLMLITDQVNLTFESRRFGSSNGSKISFYDPTLGEKAREAAQQWNIALKQGVYVGVKGPSYETAAEVEMIRRIGGDAVGMSTIFEVALASSLGMRVLGISCITNLATGIGNQKLSHAEVTEVGNRVKTTFGNLLKSIIEML